MLCTKLAHKIQTRSNTISVTVFVNTMSNYAFEVSEKVTPQFHANKSATLYKIVANRLRGKSLRRIPFIHSLNQKIQTRIKSDFAIVEGSKMFLWNDDHYNLSIGIYEPAETKLVKEQIKEGSVVIDIGASIGYYTLLFSRLVGNNGKVFAFEPKEENFEFLSRNIEINNYTNVVKEQKVVTDRPGIVSLYGKKFESVNLNDYFQNEKVDFIKIDVDGLEKKIIDGAITILENNRDIKLMMEYYPPGLEKFSGNPVEFVIKLESMRFEIFDINQKMKKTSSEELAKRYPNSKNQYTNLFLIRTTTT